jgi:UDP-N-acetylmuramoyl-tripeptide--D-alanyl-D-alanine ligase
MNTRYFKEGLLFLNLALWAIATLRQLLLSGYLWQLKEYRWDRVRAHLQTKLGRQVFLTTFFLPKALLLAAFFFRINPFYQSAFYLFYLVFAADFLIFARAVFARELRRPRFTSKMILINALTLGLASLFFLSFGSRAWVFLLVHLILPFLVFVSTKLASLPTVFLKSLIIAKAKKKIQAQPHLKVIGITGSFGKTSTKEFLAQILSSRFRVLATFKNQNTPIAIARQILKELKPDHEIYIVEMGAYKKGEIRSLCDLTSPSIGLITGLGRQHLALFGSFKALKAAKFELIESLPKNGLALFNGDNKFCRELARKSPVKTILVSTQKRSADFYADQIQVLKRRVKFRVKTARQQQVFSARLLGQQNINNLLLAIATAQNLGLDLRSINKALSQIKSLPGAMKLFFAPGGVNIIDDSYNSNPEGVLAALLYLDSFPKRRFLIFQPMIELGPVTGQEHARVLAKAQKVCQAIFLTNKNFHPIIKKEFPEIESENFILVKSAKHFLKNLPQLKKDDALLFEGRETGKYLKLFKKFKRS